MKKWKLLACVALVTFGLFSLTGCGKSTTPITTSKKIVVGTEASFRPFEWRNEQGDIIGFDIELAKEIGAQIGADVEIQNIPFDGLIAALNNKNIDMVSSAMTITEKRKESVDFSKPYFEATQAIVLKKGSSFKSLSDLKGKNVGIQNGTTGQDVVETLMGNRDPHIKRFESVLDALNTLRIDGLDAVVADKPVVQNYLLSNPESQLVLLDDTSFVKEEYGFAFRKGDTELQTQVNEALDKLEKNGKIKELATKYLGEK
ncbi:transporter substrate-binding domain-containing protein [Heliobacillus mobilis]|uniref:Transporter substrate-binding domain-containing protein n=1 Tax=Heliobacterium mobile TaxID=28064 RepID=A0A6I3SJ01_HELMO|nr:basic amino acid ABC transporter substrate-binding protein [Heliobacterium mobile]MTV48871.1 transporter substrate-binding domain-containing protein [Heliobacterium mobile]